MTASPAGLAERAVQIILERYSDFGPTLACEKLTEVHSVVMSKITGYRTSQVCSIPVISI